MKFRTKIASMVAGVAMTISGAAYAQDWEPNGVLTVEIGFGAGGSTDTMGRVIANVMKEQTGWNIIAENKTGGGGLAMFTGISQRPATGNVIGLGVNMPILINLNRRADQLPFDLDSFAYLGTAARAQLALIARADAPFDTIDEMVAHSKANDGLAIGFGAAPQRLLMEVVNRQTDAGFRFVTTEGEAETQKLLLGGQVLAGFSAGTHIQYLESGDFKMIASANNARHTYAPDTPTFRESGYDAYVDPFFYFATAADTDPVAVAALTEALANAIASDEVAEVVRNAATTETLNLGSDGTRQMMVDGLANIGVLYSE
ncbi:tripartite tricarboxylate transporter substrate binding protein [Sulfitobacter sp. AS92]|uniref:tripartite tricarboxylate transporter substrate binding protein n=1 Tax=Sulfitobacter sp. AS92 TaxID=3135783 RepID=UPI00317B74F4